MTREKNKKLDKKLWGVNCDQDVKADKMGGNRVGRQGNPLCFRGESIFKIYEVGEKMSNSRVIFRVLMFVFVLSMGGDLLWCGDRKDELNIKGFHLQYRGWTA